MIFRELSNADFRFALRCAGAEIDGGGVQTPPSRRWKIQRPIRALVNPRPAGGHILPPSRIFAITWKLRKISPPSFQYLIGHEFDTLSEKKIVKLGWIFFLENGVSVTSCHAILSQKWSSAISIADQCILKQIAKKRCQNKGNWIFYEMAVSDFQTFGFWPPN